jgi:hypothetical protein
MSKNTLKPKVVLLALMGVNAMKKEVKLVSNILKLNYHE